MELASSRKLLSVLLTVLLALNTAFTVASLSVSQTLASGSFLQKYAVTGELAAQCEAQLEAKYAVLEAQSGIPHTVFETVKNEYPIDASLRTAFQNVFSSESPDLYSKELVRHFERLCTDYLDSNSISYQKKAVKRTAEEAARIFSETVGLHNIGTVTERIRRLKNTTSAVSTVSAAVWLLTAALLYMMYSNKKKAQVYIWSGACGGAAGTAFGAVLCRFISPVRELNISPAVYRAAIQSVYNRYFLLLALGSAVIAAGFWLAFLMTGKQLSKSK